MFFEAPFLRFPISIHALHEESDDTAISYIASTTYFNPRSP